MNNATINADVTMAGEGQSLLANRYRVVKQLGQGGMGSVWLAEDTILDNRKVAIKMLPSILFANKRAYNQLKSEALVAMKLSHPNIASVRYFEENDGNPFIVEDYIEGWTLDAILAENDGVLSEDDTRRLLAPVAAALDYAHAKGVVHRDVKPGNVMITADGTPFVLDFGIAREAQETMTMVTGKLSSGTLLYMSPEQLNGAMPKPAQDVYSFAAMVYECLSGQPPFCRGQIEYQIINNPPPDLPSHIAICERVMAGLAKDPARRPVTCVQVLEDGAVPETLHDQTCIGREGVSLRDPEFERIQEEIAKYKTLIARKEEKERLDRLARERERKLEEARRLLAELRFKVESEVVYKAGDVRTIELPGGANLELVYCPPGEFLMGSPETEKWREGGETQHRVTLTKGFWIGKYPVTQLQWRSVMGEKSKMFGIFDTFDTFDTGRWSHFLGDDRPVEQVSWVDCQEFLEKAGLGLRLPTEAEWEYACRAGTTGPYAGTGNLDDMGWYCKDSGTTTHPVGQKKPNAWGLYDMHGNVWEWCQDWYGSYDGDARDPQGPASGDFRVSRGGSWLSDARDCRSALRSWDNPGYSGAFLGFRVACSED